MVQVTKTFTVTIKKVEIVETEVKGGGVMYDHQGTDFAIIFKSDQTGEIETRMDVPTNAEVMFDSRSNVYSNVYIYGTNLSSRKISGTVYMGGLGLGFSLAVGAKKSLIGSITGGSSFFGSSLVSVTSAWA